MRGKPETPSLATYNWKNFSWFLGSWLLVMAGLLSIPCFNLLFYPGNPFIHFDIPRLPRENFFAYLPAAPLICAGFILLVVLFRRLPPVEEGKWDFSRGTARLWFWVFMALGAYLRLENPHQPPGYFWDDNYSHAADIRNILDYHDCPFMFPNGWRGPYHPYLTAFLWILLPQATGHFIVLFSDALNDLAALWIFYLIGKEIGGRRMGILFLALGSTCKYMIMVTKFCYENETCVLAGALTVLFFLRLLKKPNWFHFLEWGLALGFGGYTYVAFRSWTPAMLGIVWLWVYSDSKERRFNFPRVVLGPGLLAAWMILFLYKNALLPNNNAFAGLISGPAFLAAVGIVLGWSYVDLFRVERKKGFSKLFGWATGAFAAALLMAPFYLYPEYSTHVGAITAWHKDFCLPGETWHKLWGNIRFTKELFLGQAVHPSQIPSIGDSLFEFLDIACALLGAAYFLARPSWLSGTVILLFLVSVITPILSNGPHSFRYCICSIPLLLTGAWGMNRFWLAFLQAKPGKGWRWFFILALLALLAWEIGKNHRLVWEWMDQRTDTTTVWDQAERELPNHRVYLVAQPRFYNCSMDILSDGEELFQAGPSNSIDLAPGEKGKDLAILVWGEDIQTQKKVEEEFLGVQWSKKFNFFQWENRDVPHLFWTEIPFDRVPEGGQAFIHVRRVPEWTWRRRFYTHYGIGRGLILYEDRVTRWNDNLPSPFTDGWHSARLEGNWAVKTGGTHTLGINTHSIAWFYLDGKKTLVVPPNSRSSEKSVQVNLAPGVHSVELAVNFGGQNTFPVINVSGPGIVGNMTLDELVVRSASSTSRP